MGSFFKIWRPRPSASGIPGWGPSLYIFKVFLSDSDPFSVGNHKARKIASVLDLSKIYFLLPWRYVGNQRIWRLGSNWGLYNLLEVVWTWAPMSSAVKGEIVMGSVHRSMSGVCQPWGGLSTRTVPTMALIVTPPHLVHCPAVASSVSCVGVLIIFCRDMPRLIPSKQPESSQEA